MVCPCGNAHSTRLALCRHFTAFAEMFSLLFLVVSFQDSLTLEEPVKVLKVALDEKLNYLIEEMCMTGLNFRHISSFYRKFGPVIY